MVSTDGVAVLIARGRLADAKRWFIHLEWDVLPQGRRGQRILRWGADHAWLAAGPGSPQASVRRWCRRWAPWLTPKEINKLVDDTAHSNKRWSADQCAAVLEISVRDRSMLKLWHLGANDDPNYDIRLEEQQAKAAARARRYRAAHGTGGKRGRPALELSPEDRLARIRAQGAKRVALHRALRKNASRPLKHIDPVTELSVTRPVPRPVPPPWAVLGMSRRTFFRRKAAGLVAIGVPVPFMVPAPPGRTVVASCRR